MTTPKITNAEVKHVARLAQLKLTPQEISKFQKQLAAILEYVSQLNQLNTQNIKPTSQITGLKNVFREDKSRPSLPPEEVLANAVEKEDQFFKVKSVLEEK